MRRLWFETTQNKCTHQLNYAKEPNLVLKARSGKPCCTVHVLDCDCEFNPMSTKASVKDRVLYNRMLQVDI